MMQVVDGNTSLFLNQFSEEVFQQWLEAEEEELFWLNDPFLKQILEDAIVKLPPNPVKSQLKRDLVHCVYQLKSNLQKHYNKHLTENSNARDIRIPLLAKNDIEKALSSSSINQENTIAHIELALDNMKLPKPEHENSVPSILSSIEEVQQRLNIVAARNYETTIEQQKKRAMYLKYITNFAIRVFNLWTLHKRKTNTVEKEIERLHYILQHLVQQDIVVYGGLIFERDLSNWTSFYRPRNCLELEKVDYDTEIAKVYGVWFALVTYFPLHAPNTTKEKNMPTDSSSDTDSDSNNDQEDEVKDPEQITNQIIFATFKRENQIMQVSWLLTVLASLHNAIVEIDTIKMSSAGMESLHRLYDRFYRLVITSNFLKSKFSFRNLFQLLICTRHAMHFMRYELKHSIPSVSTVVSALRDFPLPISSFTSLITFLKSEHTIGGQEDTAEIKQSLQALENATAVRKLLDDTNIPITYLTRIYEAIGTCGITSEGSLSFEVGNGIINSFEQNIEAMEIDSETNDEAVNLFFVDSTGVDSSSQSKRQHTELSNDSVPGKPMKKRKARKPRI